jgi:O-antigen/teichoic acid export membrane protein
MIALARGFQYAWPPLAYSVKDDEEAAKLYASVTTWYAAVTGLAVAGLVLTGRWVVRLLAAPDFYPAWKALPWVALGWAMYGLVTLMVTVGGRAKVTTRNFPAAIAGLTANVVLLALLVPSMGISGAGIALVGAYVVMLAVMRILTRNLFEVGFEWARLAHFTLVAGGISIIGNLLLPTSGASGLAERLAVLALIPLALWATHFVHPDEARVFRNGFSALKARRSS